MRKKVNRLSLVLNQAKRRKKKIFCAFLTLGYPNLSATERLIADFEKEGVDVVELGFPFSDPLADGPTIQFSSEQALAKGVHIQDAFRLVKRLRQKGVKIPILFFSYINPILHFGIKSFVQSAKSSGFDGVIVPDLPPEEEKSFQSECKRSGLEQVFLVALTTEKKRAAQIAHHSQGFIYFVSLKGVTGARKQLPKELQNHLKNFRRLTKKIFLVGFGVSTPAQAKQLSRYSDGVIVGSALVESLRRSGGSVKAASRFVRQMIRAVKG